MSIEHFENVAPPVANDPTSGYSDVQAKIRDATSNDPSDWGPSGTQMREIAKLTYDRQGFAEVVERMHKRLSAKGKKWKWRQIFKALVVLEYILYEGSEDCVIYFKEHILIIETLKDFRYIDEYQIDQGASVRQKAEDITNLLVDDTRLREERRTRAGVRDRMGNGWTGRDDPSPRNTPASSIGFEQNHRKGSPSWSGVGMNATADLTASPTNPLPIPVTGGVRSFPLYPASVRSYLEHSQSSSPKRSHVPPLEGTRQTLESQHGSDHVDPSTPVPHITQTPPRNATHSASHTVVEDQDDGIPQERQGLWDCMDLNVMMNILDTQSKNEFVRTVSSAKIYQRLIAYVYVQLKTSHMHRSSLKALDSLRDAIVIWQAWDTVQWLAEHHTVRSTLWGILNEGTVINMFGCAPKPSIALDQSPDAQFWVHLRHFELQDLLKSDLLSIQNHLLTVLSNRDKKKAFLGLCSTDPVPALNLLQTILDQGNLPRNDQPRFARTLTRLVKSSACLPDCLMLSGVRRTGKDPVAGGGFADVWTGYLASTPVAIKALRIYDHSNQEKALKDFAHEAIIWRLLRHPNILKFYGVFRGDDRLCLVSPWMSAGNIVKYLENNPNGDRLALLGDVVNGLAYLHDFQPAIIHGDLKGANIFVTPARTACLGDFGLSRFRDSQESTLGATTGNTTGTLRWQAPELFDSFDDGGTTHPSQESDIYSFGCVCLELMTGKPPFMEIRRDGAVMKAIMNGQTPRRPIEDLVKYGLDDNLWAVMEKCWSHDPTRRPEIEWLLGYFGEDRGSAIQDNSIEAISHEIRSSLDQYGFPEDHIWFVSKSAGEL